MNTDSPDWLLVTEPVGCTINSVINLTFKLAPDPDLTGAATGLQTSTLLPHQGYPAFEYYPVLDALANPGRLFLLAI